MDTFEKMDTVFLKSLDAQNKQRYKRFLRETQGLLSVSDRARIGVTVFNEGSANAVRIFDHRLRKRGGGND